MTMSSGVRWDETFHLTHNSDEPTPLMAERVPGGVLQLMAGLPRLHAPGSVFDYNSGDTYLLGACLRAAVGRPLADYMAERIWQPAGMEFDGFYTLESEGGQEIGGSRAGMALRDLGRIAQLVLDDGMIDGRRVIAARYIAESAIPRFAVDQPRSPGITGYGHSWWLGDGVMSALGFAGQRIDVFRDERLAVVTLGAFPQPPHAAADDTHHRRAVAAFTAAVRGM